MRVLFALDRRFAKSNNDVLTVGASGAESGLRYLEYFDELLVCARAANPNAQDLTHFSSVASPQIEHVLLPSLTLSRSSKHTIAEALTKVDAVICRLPTVIGAYVCKLARSRGIPYAIELGGCPWDGYWNYGTIQSRVYAPIAWIETKSLVGRAPFVSYVTSSFLQTRYPSCKTARTVAASNVVIDPPKHSVLRRRLGHLNNEKTVFGTIGTLHGNTKGIQDALRALASVKDTLGPFEYRILGQGDSTRLHKLVRRLGLTENVSFDGTRTPGSAIFDWLDGIDVYLQPSLQEGLPRALIEAMSRGCPAIGSSAGGIPELLDSTVIHRPQDTVHLAKLVLKARNLDWQAENAKRNWQTAGKFHHDHLHRIRSEFWNAFADYVARRVEARVTSP